MSTFPYKVWDTPPTEEQFKELLSADGWLEKIVVPVTLGELLDNDFEEFLDLLAERAGYDLLQEIGYSVEGHDEDTLHIRVSGDASGLLTEDE